MRRAWKKTREEISKPIYIEYREIWAQEKGREPNSVNVMATERAGRSILRLTHILGQYWIFGRWMENDLRIRERVLQELKVVPYANKIVK